MSSAAEKLRQEAEERILEQTHIQWLRGVIAAFVATRRDDDTDDTYASSRELAEGVTKELLDYLDPPTVEDQIERLRRDNTELQAEVERLKRELRVYEGDLS